MHIIVLKQNVPKSIIARFPSVGSMQCLQDLLSSQPLGLGCEVPAE